MSSIMHRLSRSISGMVKKLLWGLLKALLVALALSAVVAFASVYDKAMAVNTAIIVAGICGLVILWLLLSGTIALLRGNTSKFLNNMIWTAYLAIILALTALLPLIL